MCVCIYVPAAADGRFTPLFANKAFLQMKKSNKQEQLQ